MSRDKLLVIKPEPFAPAEHESIIVLFHYSLVTHTATIVSAKSGNIGEEWVRSFTIEADNFKWLEIFLKHEREFYSEGQYPNAIYVEYPEPTLDRNLQEAAATAMVDISNRVSKFWEKGVRGFSRLQRGVNSGKIDAVPGPQKLAQRLVQRVFDSIPPSEHDEHFPGRWARETPDGENRWIEHVPKKLIDGRMTARVIYH